MKALLQGKINFKRPSPGKKIQALFYWVLEGKKFIATLRKKFDRPIHDKKKIKKALLRKKHFEKASLKKEKIRKASPGKKIQKGLRKGKK